MNRSAQEIGGKKVREKNVGCSFLREVRHVNCVTHSWESFFYRIFLRDDNGAFYLYQGGIIGEQRLVYLHVVDIFRHVTRIARPLSLSFPSSPLSRPISATIPFSFIRIGRHLYAPARITHPDKTACMHTTYTHARAAIACPE